MDLVNLSEKFPEVCQKYFRHEIYCTPEVDNILRRAVDEGNAVSLRIMVNTLLFQLSRPDSVLKHECGEMAIIKTRLGLPDSITIQARVGPKSGTDATAIIIIGVAHSDEQPNFRRVGATQMSTEELLEESLDDYWRHHQSNISNVQEKDCKTSAPITTVGVHGAKKGAPSDSGL